MNNETDICPACGHEYNGYECDNCGFADNLEQGLNQYETPSGNIVWCSEEEAFEREYINICPACCFNVITWWEMEDHGMCIECWHRKHTAALTEDKIRDII